MSKSVGKSVTRVDAYEKATGRAKYVADLCDQSALVARILHATIAHGYVKSIDTTEAEAVPGVVKVLTCFNVPDYRFPTAGHPWSTDPAHQDVADRLLLNHHVRYYGDDIAAVIAENEIAAAQAVRALKVEYEELPFVLDVQKAMEPDAPQIHEDCPGNVLKHTDIRRGDYQTAIQEPGLIRVEGWYDTPTVQHCHIENHGCFAYEEAGRVVVVTSTQIPHIIRRVVGQALGLPWGKVRIIKPYIGGGFGNNCLGQLRTQGLIWLVLCAAGLVWLLYCRSTRAQAIVAAAASLGAMVLFTRTQSLGDHQSLILAPFYLLMLFGLCAKLTQQKAKPWLRNAAAGVLAVFLVVNFGNALRLPGKNVQTLALSSESLDLTRRTDLAQMRAVTDFVLEHCSAAPDAGQS